MTDGLTALLSRVRGRDVLVDTNILLMYIVGTLDPQLIPMFKRTKMFTRDDYTILCGFLQHFRSIVTVPNILTEVSNLAGQMAEPRRTRVFQIFSQAVQVIREQDVQSTIAARLRSDRVIGGPVIREQYVQSTIAAEDSAFPRLGLTDVVIAKIAEGRVLVLTDDFKLSQHLERSGLDVVNFNHIRMVL